MPVPSDGAPAPTAADALALERRFPGIAAKIARYPLTVLPTPVEPLERLGAATGIASLWVKRDEWPRCRGDHAGLSSG